MIERLRRIYRHWRVRRRRRKLLAAYARVERLRYGLGPGFSPTIHAYSRLIDEGLAVIVETDDGESELRWLWPEDAPDLEGGASVQNELEADSP